MEIFSYKWASTLLIPLRNIFLSPQQLIQRLHLQDNHETLEIGPGPGYFSAPLAQFLTQSTLSISDIQPEMIQLAKKRLEKKQISNIHYHVANSSDFPFSDQHFDRIFMVTVLGEVANQSAYFSEFARMLKKGGILSISEQRGDPHRMSPDQIEKLAREVGFVFLEKFGGKKTFTINFIKK